jgi:CRP-like cAMP-binding protein
VAFGAPIAELQSVSFPLAHSLAMARRRPFEREEIVFHHGDVADSLHLISKGRFAVPHRDAARPLRDARRARAG